MLYIVNYRGTQVHSSAAVKVVSDDFVLFEGGAFADVADKLSKGAVRFVAPGEKGYIQPGQTVGAGIVVADISDDGGYVYAKTAGASAAKSADGKYSVNLGKPGSSDGVQLGEGNVQFNQF